MAGAGSSIKQALTAAETAAKAGDSVRAIGLYRQILMQVPKHSKAKKALARLEKIGNTPAMTQADAQGLIQILNTGDFEAARRSAKHLSQRFSNEPFVFNILGYTSGMVGDEKEAIAAYKWAIKLNPNFVEAMSNYGSYLVQIGKTSEAVPVLRKAVVKKPDYAEAHHNLGLALAALEDSAALLHLDKAVQLHPNYANAFNSRGNFHKTAGTLALARDDFQRAAELAPSDRVIQENLSAVLADLGDVDGALAITDQLLSKEPADVDLLRRRAVQLNTLGRMEEARVAFGELLKKRPGDGEAIGTLLRISASEDQGTYRDMALSQMNDPLTENHDRVLMSFGLAADFEKQGDVIEAGRWLNTANSTNRKALPELPVPDATRFKQARSVFANGIPARLTNAGNPSTRPIFVVGMMRSGTSLVEQIIASHSHVFGAGELNAVTTFGTPIMDRGKSISPKHIEDFAQRYLSVLDAADKQHPRTVDKMPANFFLVGLIKTAFPNAAIINTVRDPRDTCFSIWKNFFDTHAHQYAYDQSELAAFANEYRSLMNFWDEVFPGEVYHIRYEELVANQETESRKLLEHLGLDWEPEVLDFHKTKRAVRTASVNQVRQKMYTSSLRSWEPYQDHLRELLDGLDQNLWKDALQGSPAA